MKYLVYGAAVAALASVGLSATANAQFIDSTNIEIWAGLTPGSNIGSANQQALPSTRALLPLVAASTAFTPAINYDDVAGTDSVDGFFGSRGSSARPSTCNASCLGETLSTSGFAFATLMEFTFTLATAQTLQIIHDDGISIFTPGTEGSDSNDLLHNANSAPTSAVITNVSLNAGTYELFYSEANGLPAELEVAVVPGPIVGAGLPGLFAGLGGLVALARRRRRKG
jgi:hypothetical protein